MKLENQAVSLELAKQLKELESAFELALKPIENFDGYFVSDVGKIISVRGNSRGRVLKPYWHKGYLRVVLFKGAYERYVKFVHRVVAEAWLPTESKILEVNHKNGDKSNNHIWNLEWVTKEENQRHSREVLGNTNRGVRNGNHGYRKSRFYPSESLRSQLSKLGVPRNKQDIVSLGEMLPNQSMDLTVKLYKGDDAYWAECHKWGKKNHLIGGEETEADARAKMLIWLKGNKYI